VRINNRADRGFKKMEKKAKTKSIHIFKSPNNEFDLYTTALLLIYT